MRHEKLKELKDLLESGQENFSKAQELEMFFFGTHTSCRCKYSAMVSQLNRWWEVTGKKEYENGN
jgi:hypothetical protein